MSHPKEQAVSRTAIGRKCDEGRLAMEGAVCHLFDVKAGGVVAGEPGTGAGQGTRRIASTSSFQRKLESILILTPDPHVDPLDPGHIKMDPSLRWDDE